MKHALLVERMLFIFLLSFSGWIAYILLTKKNTMSSENALLIILSVFWLILEHKTVKTTFEKLYLYFKKAFHFPAKKKLRKA